MYALRDIHGISVRTLCHGRSWDHEPTRNFRSRPGVWHHGSLAEKAATFAWQQHVGAEEARHGTAEIMQLVFDKGPAAESRKAYYWLINSVRNCTWFATRPKSTEVSHKATTRNMTHPQTKKPVFTLAEFSWKGLLIPNFRTGWSVTILSSVNVHLSGANCHPLCICCS
jgi:hypothetical protein